MFESQNGDFDIQQIHLNDKGEFVVRSGDNNCGIIGKTDIDAKIIKENTITIDMFGSVYFRDFKFKMVTHARVFALHFLERELTREQGLFIVSQLFYLKAKFSYSNMASWKKVKDIKISLPINENEQIDFDFMESFIAELEAERVRELEAYLKATGLTDTTLTQAEQKAIEAIYGGGMS